jgi:sulfotransferase
MPQKYHFISGLPRAGTTLLSTILNQNPKFQASISGPLARFSRAIIEQSSSQGGYRHQCDESKRKKIIQGIFESYYDDPNKETFFDTNRGWTLLLPLLKEIHPGSKVLCCVRDIKWILDSFEQLARKNPLSISNIFSPEENANVYTRCQTLLREDKTVGFAYTALKQAITSDEKNMIFLIEYEQLCRNPTKIMKAVYNFIGEEYYDHNFDDVEASYDEFDDDVNLKGLHTTRKSVKWIERATILPPDIIQHCAKMEVWR